MSKRSKTNSLVSYSTSNISSQILKTIYKSNYPFEEIYELFYHKNREFCLVSQSELWNRRVIFTSVENFKNKILSRPPLSIHIGPIFNNISDKSPSCYIISKELVFDVDLPDYGDLRTCCGSDKKACNKCWGLAQFAIRTLNFLLTDIFGYKHVLFFYSGKKGFHCWVFDEEAKLLDENERTSILNYLINIKNDKYIINMIWSKFGREFCEKKLIDCVDFKDCLEKDVLDLNDNIKLRSLSRIWPRFDVGVTKDLSHAVKSPYSIHTKTNEVCYLLSPNGSENPFIDQVDLKENVESFRKLVSNIKSNSLS